MLKNLWTKLTSSQGFKRSLGTLLLLAGQTSQLAAYQNILTDLGLAFGVTGVVHAALAPAK